MFTFCTSQKQISRICLHSIDICLDGIFGFVLLFPKMEARPDFDLVSQIELILNFVIRLVAFFPFRQFLFLY